jgi:hypothetical protein
MNPLDPLDITNPDDITSQIVPPPDSPVPPPIVVVQPGPRARKGPTFVGSPPEPKKTPRIKIVIEVYEEA